MSMNEKEEAMQLVIVRWTVGKGELSENSLPKNARVSATAVRKDNETDEDALLRWHAANNID